MRHLILLAVLLALTGCLQGGLNYDQRRLDVLANAIDAEVDAVEVSLIESPDGEIEEAIFLARSLAEGLRVGGDVPSLIDAARKLGPVFRAWLMLQGLGAVEVEQRVRPFRIALGILEIVAPPRDGRGSG